MDNSIEFDFSILPFQEGKDILMAELSDLGFNSFWENENHLMAYIEATDDGLLKSIDGIPILLNSEFKISYTIKAIPKQNWNAIWESSFEPVVLDNCIIKAPFHNIKEVYDYQIIIYPKMAFGTGHHQTTKMILRLLFTINLKNKMVFDVGCGTGILGILALKLGAKRVYGNDVDDWCIDNAEENFALNGFDKSYFNLYLGTLDEINVEDKFDLVIANINRNIILQEIHLYKKILKPKGCLLLSGFYVEDYKFMEENNAFSGLKLVEKLQDHNWCALSFVGVE